MALLGVLKAGGAYVPLDPALPGERLASCWRTPGCGAGHAARRSPDGCRRPERALVCLDERTACEERARERGETRRRRCRPDSLAYVIYTSGSTGQAQGGGGRRTRRWRTWSPGDATPTRADAGRRARSSSRRSAFDAVGLGDLGRRSAAARAAASSRRRTPVARRSWLGAGSRTTGVTASWLTPTPLARWRVARPAELRCRARRCARCSPAASALRLARWAATGAAGCSTHYGPTEATVVATCRSRWPPQAGGGGAADRPAARQRAGLRARRAAASRCRSGVPGELYVGGAGWPAATWAGRS